MIDINRGEKNIDVQIISWINSKLIIELYIKCKNIKFKNDKIGKT